MPTIVMPESESPTTEADEFQNIRAQLDHVNKVNEQLRLSLFACEQLLSLYVARYNRIVDQVETESEDSDYEYQYDDDDNPEQ